MGLAFDHEDNGSFDEAIQERHRQWTIAHILAPFFKVHTLVTSAVERF